MREKKNKDKNKFKAPITIALILVLLFASSQLVAFLFVPPNLQVNNKDIGMIKKSELDSVLEKRLAAFENNKVEISYEDQVEEYTLSDLGISFKKEKLKEDILESNKANILNFILTAKQGQNFEPEVVSDDKKFKKALEVFEDDTAEKPIDAYYKYSQGNVIIVDEEPGYILGKDELQKELLKDPLKDNLKIALNLEFTQPEITRKILSKQGIKEKVSSYQTTFNPANTSRSTNVRLAVNAINGTILAPNETFSFNDIVGQRTAARGYQSSTVFENGRPVSGIGGGICQVSTTLYNTVLLGDFEVVARRNHSISVPYVALSRDATVSWGSQDFKFKNQTDKHLYIHGEVQGNQIIFDIFSTKTPNKRVVLESQTISKDANKYRSRLIKKVFLNNNLAETSVVSTDTYKSSSSSSETNDFEKIVEKKKPAASTEPKAPDPPNTNNNSSTGGSSNPGSSNNPSPAKPAPPKDPPKDIPKPKADPEPEKIPDDSNSSETPADNSNIAE